ncbi:fumarylacetoacetate hydrolase family protein [Sedimentibacter sp. MB31-C6]|uniref:fumarylacetoacetate hydrolase family protein n=1 Tax=Sedimentibacter sp. MB31-C6 TaxID=3109366 RepID=UPI002DDD40AA|nr:fumarylacetoacetate hydrolase family protein [Sedimentibacter sp. MB36-C1]WSI04696.1 fumarylacetoacetate hydrolase family protein [Sedimentibacter sp. MB36-C1]
MYFLTYIYKGTESIGLLNKDHTCVIPVQSVFSNLKCEIPTNMIHLIETFNQLNIKDFENTVHQCKDLIDLNKIKIMAPIPFPKRNIICLGKNYLDHINEVKSLKNVSSDIPSKPIYFSKIAYPAVGHMDYIDSHSDIVKELDYEVELAVIISKKCKNVSKENAEKYIFGYTIGNDVSARNIQTEHVQWHKGKSFDTFSSLGPYIVHKNKISFPPKLEIKSYINGELRQNSNTDSLIFDIPTIINDITSGITLYPGDIILTGTPAGVGAGFNPPKYLKQGDKIDCIIENIGTLTNIVK